MREKLQETKYDDELTDKINEIIEELNAIKKLIEPTS